MNQPSDHRLLNRDLDIFATDPLAGAGLPLWLPDGAVIRSELAELARDIARADGCREVFTPALGKKALFERSGHWTKFADDMFPPMEVGGDQLVLRPANCPHHALVYAAGRHSHRDLPIRLHELAPMFRAERSGVVSGLSRVRQINLDDTHVFCRPDQVGEEVVRALRSALRAQHILGLPVESVRLSLRDDGPSYLGDDHLWEQAEAALRAAAASVLGDGRHGSEVVKSTEARGEAAFYGPKLDLQVGDGRGHEQSIATVQIDFVQPERFDLTYAAAEGGRQRVVMIHRGTVGSMERVTAALLEHHRGRLPVWLAPVQVCLLPVTAEQQRPAASLRDRMYAAGLRPRLDADGSLGARVRESRRRREPVIVVLGPAEEAAGLARVQDVGSGWRGDVALDQLVESLASAHRDRAASVGWPGLDHQPS